VTKNILLIRLLAVAGIVAVAVTAISYISFKDSAQTVAKSDASNAAPCGYVTGVSYSTDTSDADKMSTVTVSTSSKGAPCAGAKAMITVYSGNNTVLKTAFCDIDKDTCTALGVNQQLSAVGRVDVKLIKSGVSGPNQPASALGQ
jgi:hypothetical protein